MSFLDILDNLVLGPLNFIDRFEWLLKGVSYGDTGYKMSIPRCDKGGGYSLKEVENLLNGYGITVYGRTHDARFMYFHVKKRQANWAEYLLLHAGVELQSATVDARNPGYVASHEPGWMPKPWSER